MHPHPFLLSSILRQDLQITQAGLELAILLPQPRLEAQSLISPLTLRSTYARGCLHASPRVRVPSCPCGHWREKPGNTVTGDISRLNAHTPDLGAKTQPRILTDPGCSHLKYLAGIVVHRHTREHTCMRTHKQEHPRSADFIPTSGHCRPLGGSISFSVTSE